MGLPLTGTIDNFQAKLAAKGIYPDRASAIGADPYRYYHDYFEQILRAAKSDGKEGNTNEE